MANEKGKNPMSKEIEKITESSSSKKITIYSGGHMSKSFAHYTEHEIEELRKKSN